MVAAEILDVSSSCTPGGSSMSSCELAKSSGGTKAVGITMRIITETAKNAAPAPMVFQRFATHQRNSFR